MKASVFTWGVSIQIVFDSANIEIPLDHICFNLMYPILTGISWIIVTIHHLARDFIEIFSTNQFYIKPPLPFYIK